MSKEKRGKYSSNDLKTKVHILNEVREGKLSRKEIAEKYDLKKSTLATYIRNEAAIVKAFEEEQFVNSRKRLRSAAHPELEEAVYKWVTEVRTHNLPMTGDMIRAKAQQFSERLGIEGFRASEGWLARFRERHSLIFKHVCGERADVDEDLCENWKTSELARILAEYAPEDIFNCDETALFFKALPDKTITFKGDPCTGGKRSKERVTVLVAANMTGTERLPLLVIGKSKTPRCFRNIPRLPTDYRFNKKAWMTREIFQDWLQKLNRQFASKGRKVVLVADNCSAHTKMPELSMIRLIFLPPATTSLLQPMDQGIIKHLKGLYRKHLMARILLCLDQGKRYEVTLLAAIHMLVKAWTDMPSQVIANCFRHCGFSCDGNTASSTTASATTSTSATASATTSATASATTSATTIEDENFDEECSALMSALPENVSFDDYVAIDDGVLVCGQLTDDEIIASVQRPEGQEDDSCESDAEEPPPRPSPAEASAALDVLANFATFEDTDGTMWPHIEDMRKFVFAKRLTGMRQQKISAFFSK